MTNPIRESRIAIYREHAEWRLGNFDGVQINYLNEDEIRLEETKGNWIDYGNNEATDLVVRNYWYVTT